MASENAKKSFGKIKWAILLRTLVPMLLMGIVIAGSAIKFNERAIKSEVQDSLKMSAISVAEAYNQMYPGNYELRGSKLISLYKGDVDITAEYDFIDSIKKSTGVDVSIIHGNTRILTTLMDEMGRRQISTGVNQAIVSEMSTPTSYFCYEGLIGSEKYYAYYTPLINSDGSVIGMVGVAKQYDQIVSVSQQALVPILIITIISMGLAAVISVRYAGELIDAIQAIERFLQNMIKGELSNEMPTRVLERGDELGRAGKGVLDMQNAIRVLVERDPLTTLYNRRYGGARLRKLQRDSEKNGMPYSLVLGDIDFFKKVNDTYGHDAGDVVLKRVSDILKKSMVGKGFVARWGGEEFLLVFSKTDGKATKHEMELILDKIRAMEIFYDGLTIKVTMTFGVVDGALSADFGTLLREADERLYFGKTRGRNRVVLEEAANEKEAGEKESDEKKVAETTTKASEKEVASENTGIVTEKSEAQKPGNEAEDKSDNKTENKTKEETKSESNEVVIDDAFLQQIIDKMSEKLLKETSQD